MMTSRAACYAGLVTLLVSSVSPLAAAAAQGTQTPTQSRLSPALAAFLTLRAPTCELLASPPDDADSQVPGVKFENINTVPALALCEQAAQQPQRRPRDLYLFGR